MKKLIKSGSRFILGFGFLIFGLNGFFSFMETPPLAPEALAFVIALVKTGYMMPLVKAIEVVSGIMILAGGKTEFLGLVLLAPVLVNIFLIHAVLDPAGLALPIALVIMFKIRVWHHRDKYFHLFV